MTDVNKIVTKIQAALTQFGIDATVRGELDFDETSIATIKINFNSVTTNSRQEAIESFFTDMFGQSIEKNVNGTHTLKLKQNHVNFLKLLPEHFFEQLYKRKISLTILPEALQDSIPIFHDAIDNTTQKNTIHTPKVIFCNGLPTVVMANSQLSPNFPLSPIIENQFSQKLPDYITQLSLGKDKKEVINDLKSDFVSSNNIPAPFDFFCAISYECEGQLKVAHTDNRFFLKRGNQSLFDVNTMTLQENDQFVINNKVQAIVPDTEKRNQMNNQSLAYYKARIISIIEQNYPWKPLFHHHHNRRVAVCRAISEATSAQQIALILLNQRNMESGNLFLPINNSILNEAWSEKLRNKFTKKSGYQNAIRLALEETGTIMTTEAHPNPR